jgi:L-ascorbate metabolism protein UlaG (beta-lactamase superfamily)
MTGLLKALGRSPAGERLARIRRSPNFRDSRFQNPVPTTVTTPGSFWPMMKQLLFGHEARVPKRPPPIVSLTRSAFADAPPSGLRVTWLGHSTTLIEIDGARVLVDPIWSDRVSPSQAIGPKRFHAPPLPFDQLPALDAVIITHDHYDHLDAPMIQALAAAPAHANTPFITTLGVGAHLEAWGVAPERITELDWNESTQVATLTITATPARHFSGRAFHRDRTLWASWVIAGPAHRVFHIGDSGLFDGMAAIGKAHGPFDLTLVKIGAYAPEWPDIHLTPEDAVRVHQMLGGPLMLPIHWGTFNLAMHAWNEPAERLLVAAERAGVRITVPRPGEMVEPASPPVVESWWRGS